MSIDVWQNCVDKYIDWILDVRATETDVCTIFRVFSYCHEVGHDSCVWRYFDKICDIPTNFSKRNCGLSVYIKSSALDLFQFYERIVTVTRIKWWAVVDELFSREYLVSICSISANEKQWSSWQSIWCKFYPLIEPKRWSHWWDSSRCTRNLSILKYQYNSLLQDNVE